MRATSRVVLIACSASAIGAPAAVACSPQDYMTPEEWQALSAAQRAENVAHAHASPDTPATTPAAAPADPPARSDMAGEPSDPASGSHGAPRLELPPTGSTAPILPSLERGSHRNPADDAAPAAGARDQERPSRRAASGTPPVSTSESPRAASGATSARKTVVAVQQLARLGDARAAERAAARRAERRAAQRRPAARRATGETATTPERRDRTGERVTPARPDTRASGRTQVRADDAPARSSSGRASTELTAWAALLAFVAACAALLMRRPRPAAPVVAASPRTPVAPDPDAAAPDPVEEELQAIIAEGTRACSNRDDDAAQVLRAGEDSSTATNSA